MLAASLIIKLSLPLFPSIVSFTSRLASAYVKLSVLVPPTRFTPFSSTVIVFTPSAKLTCSTDVNVPTLVIVPASLRETVSFPPFPLISSAALRLVMSYLKMSAPAPPITSVT